MFNFLLTSNIFFWYCPVRHILPDCYSKKVKASADNHLQMLYDVGPTRPSIRAQTEECIRSTSVTPRQIHFCPGTHVNYYCLSVSLSQGLCLLNECTTSNLISLSHLNIDVFSQISIKVEITRKFCFFPLTDIVGLIYKIHINIFRVPEPQYIKLTLTSNDFCHYPI